MSKICPAVKKSCSYYDTTIKNKCSLRTPRISNNGKTFYCKSHTSGAKIEDMGLFSLITEGTST